MSENPTGRGAESPLVSVVVPTFGRPRLLRRAIESVRRQTLTNWELLVIDDNESGSPASMETSSLVSLFLDDPRIRYITHDTNRGGSQARNTGILAAAGKFIAFLDDDDEWLADKLAQQCRRLESLPPEFGAVYCGYYVDTAATREPRVVTTGEVTRPFPAILVDNFIGTTSTLLCRRSVFQTIGMFDVEMPAAQDRELLIRLCRTYRIATVRTPLVRFNWHDGPRVTKQLDRKLEAQEIIYERYADILETHPRLHSRFLVDQGKLQLRCGQPAASTFFRAWRVDPFRLPALFYALLCSVDSSTYEWVRRTTWRVRRLGSPKASRSR